MKQKITSPILLLLPILLFGQMINNFDAEPEAGYWGYNISENADTILSYINASYVADPATEGSGAMQLDYSVHNNEDWGGYARIYHMIGGGGGGGGGGEPGSTIEGSWKLSPEAGALHYGPGDGTTWWANSFEDVTTRACLFDDEYVFNADGSYNNVLDTETWLETWQGVEEGCGTPIAPHDGSNAATWDYNTGTGTVTLNGVGAYLGLAKAYNGGELTDPADAPASITYDIAFSGDDSDPMTVSINVGSGVWTYKLVEAGSALGQASDWGEDWSWNTILDLRPEDGEVWDWSGYDSISLSYYNSVPQSLEGRVHFRLNLCDYAGIADPASYTGFGEYYYSFFYILDNEPGWNTITLPLVRNDAECPAGGPCTGGFNLTGWNDWGPSITDNGVLDKDAIAGFHLEFSISGGGDGDYSNGTIVLDDFKLTGSQNVLTNPGFELADAQDDGFGWGSAVDGGHAEVVTDASMAYSGDNYLDIGVTGGFGVNAAVFYTEDSIPAQYAETWRFSGFGKSLSGGDGGGAYFKLEGKDAGGTVLGTTDDVAVAVTDEWENHSVEFVMPEGTVKMTAVIVASRSDGVTSDFAFDDMFLMNIGMLDIIPPDPVQNVGATPASYYNLVTWSDNDGEEGERYNVYASTEPITDSLSLALADVVATNVLEGTQGAAHYLHYPLEDMDVAYYYAVVCEDASNNVGESGSSDGSITNTAKGVPTISLTPPATFAADGDLQEWYDSGILPFELGATDNSYGTPHLGSGEVDDDDDLYGIIYTAVDNDYFYVAAEIFDNVVNNDASAGWWTADIVQLCVGFYDQRGPKHVGMQRGAEPDYRMYFNPTRASLVDGAGVLAEHGDGNYFHEVFNPDYVFEFRVLLDDILIGDDVRLIPANGTRTPFEPMIYDNDGDGLEAIMVLSPTNNDNAHQTCEVWSNTWIGDQSTVGIDGDDGVIAYEFALFHNYPNPFNPVTTIKFSIPETQRVTLKVYNLMGREVLTLVDQELQAGYHTTKLHAGNMASGIYFYKLMSEKKAIKQKMLLLK